MAKNGEQTPSLIPEIDNTLNTGIDTNTWLQLLGSAGCLFCSSSWKISHLVHAAATTTTVTHNKKQALLVISCSVIICPTSNDCYRIGKQG